MLKVNQTKQ